MAVNCVEILCPLLLPLSPQPRLGFCFSWPTAGRRKGEQFTCLIVIPLHADSPHLDKSALAPRAQGGARFTRNSYYTRARARTATVERRAPCKVACSAPEGDFLSPECLDGANILEKVVRNQGVMAAPHGGGRWKHLLENCLPTANPSRRCHLLLCVGCGALTSALLEYDHLHFMSFQICQSFNSPMLFSL